jgi:hypothetical protein
MPAGDHVMYSSPPNLSKNVYMLRTRRTGSSDLDLFYVWEDRQKESCSAMSQQLKLVRGFSTKKKMYVTMEMYQEKKVLSIKPSMKRATL